MSAAQWPVMRTYSGSELRRIALPLGGIGTGTVSLGGRGDLRDWEVMNRPAKGYTPPRGFFAIRVQAEGNEPVLRALEGQLDPVDFEGAHGTAVPGHGLPRFRQAEFRAAYPLGQLHLSDPDLPVTVRLDAFNPLVPTDAEASGYPAAVLRYTVTNTGAVPLEVTLSGNLPNVIGADGSNGKPERNTNSVRRENGLVGVFASSDGVDPAAEQWGTMALSTVDDGAEVSTRTAWADLSWGDSLLDFWDDLTADGRLDERTSTAADPTASLATTRTIAAGESAAVTFFLTWHFPNRQAWGTGLEVASDDACCNPSDGCCGTDSSTVGNYYTTRWADAWAAAAELSARLSELEAATVEFVQAFCGSDLPDEMAEAALFNLSTLRCQTSFRTADGRFFGWEGCSEKAGCCDGSCTHVWNYEQATAHLFGSLARSMREIEFAHATDDRGLMSFRVLLPLATRARSWGHAAADGQMGSLIKLHRDWKLSGDDEMLRQLWPHARRALEFCWIPGGWDADQDGVMEGCQHNTYDIEFYGPNPQMGGWYLAALRAGEEMARHLEKNDFADKCRRLFESGAAWMDANLFNGEYYRHEIRPAGDEESIAAGLRHTAGAKDLVDPELQLGDGCLIDQLVGQAAAYVGGLGPLLDSEHMRTTLQSILRHNYRSDFYGHFNHMRTYALADEPGILISSYPRGNRPTRPFPYFTEVWPGLEYTLATGLIYEGMVDEALSVVRDVRARFNGLRRNPFNEAECGYHYARSMASWGLVVAWTGFEYDATSATMRFRSADGSRFFWSTGDAWGTSVQRTENGTRSVEVSVHGGAVRLGAVGVAGDTFRVAEPVPLRAGDTLVFTGSV
ncbi:MAG TPA: GH116 family glycosyl-hydrolase [Mycobacteriales bacterium]|nr:GH116 family glycosyl-hydrolase [Mycobacteriales bacterium]